MLPDEMKHRKIAIARIVEGKADWKSCLMENVPLWAGWNRQYRDNPSFLQTQESIIRVDWRGFNSDIADPPTPEDLILGVVSVYIKYSRRNMFLGDPERVDPEYMYDCAFGIVEGRQAMYTRGKTFTNVRVAAAWSYYETARFWIKREHEIAQGRNLAKHVNEVDIIKRMAEDD